jgi:hypothetical protein
MFYIPIGMISGAPVSVGRYVWHSMIPSLIGNILGGILRESSLILVLLSYIQLIPLVGIPMVLFYAPPSLPLFRERGEPQDDLEIARRGPSSVVPSTQSSPRSTGSKAREARGDSDELELR